MRRVQHIGVLSIGNQSNIIPISAFSPTTNACNAIVNISPYYHRLRKVDAKLGAKQREFAIGAGSKAFLVFEVGHLPV